MACSQVLIAGVMLWRSGARFVLYRSVVSVVGEGGRLGGLVIVGSGRRLIGLVRYALSAALFGSIVFVLGDVCMVVERALL